MGNGFVLFVAALAVGCFCSGMVEVGGLPGDGIMAVRTLALKVVGWLFIEMTALAVCNIAGCMAEIGRFPGCVVMAK